MNHSEREELCGNIFDILENKMKRLNVFLVIIAVMSSLSLAKEDSGKGTKIESLLKIDWKSIQYNKNITIYNPRNSSNQSPSNTSEDIQVRCNIDILDPNVIIGTCSQAVITEITDNKGQVISSEWAVPNTSTMTYNGLQYDRQTVMPKRDPQWKQIMESVLRIRKQASTGPQWVLKLRPSSLQIQLSKDILEKSGGTIGSIKGYFYALSAKSLKKVDVPLKRNDNWVNVTDNEQIHIKDVQHSGSSLTYSIESRQLNGNSRNFGSFSIKVSDYLPNQIITAQQFLRDDGSLSSAFFGSSSQLPAHIGGNGSIGGGDAAQITSIRFVIAEEPEP